MIHVKRKAEERNIWRTMKANLRIEDGTNDLLKLAYFLLVNIFCD